MKRLKVFLVVLAMFLTSAAFAQRVDVRGVVRDAATGENVPFAAIQVKGTTTGSTTDAEGKYSITVASNAVLVFSSIGYHTVEIAVAGKREINVDLVPDAEALEGTVVVGYGSAKKIGNIVGSVSVVKTDIVRNAPAATALDALQGQVAGLSVMTTGGIAGDNSTSMTLHGTGSLGTSTAPLYIIDGVPSSSRTIMAMNPNDILSVTVLKDASSTSIYGARAANGVVYVTTKSGSYDAKARVTVRAQGGISTTANKQFYDNMMSGDELKEFWLRIGTFTPAQIKENYTDKGYTANTKWHEVMQNMTNPQYQSDVTVEGGGSKVAYMISASQFHQRGTTIGNYYDRYTVRSNVQGHPKKWLKVGMNLNLSIDEKQQNDNWMDSSLDGDLYTSGSVSYLLNPLIPVYDEDGKLASPKFVNGMTNPYYYMYTYPDVTNRYGINGNVFIELEPVKNLKIRSQLGTDTFFSYRNYKYLASSLIRSGKGAKGKSTQMTSNNTITNTIEYSFDIGHDHKFTLLAGQEGISNWYDYFTALSSGQTDDRSLLLQNGTATSRDMSESSSASRFLSFFGHIDYNFADKYIVDATVRNDASSRFGRNHRNGWFWAVGARWNASKEGFLKDASWLSDAHFRVNYGTQGNAEIGNYQHLALIGTTSEQYNGAEGWVIDQPSNYDLTWEKQALLTVGAGARIAKIFDVDVQFYHRNTTDMLMDVPYPYTTGFDKLTANIGSMSNTGVDITLGVDILRGKDYYLNFSTVFNYNSEKITELFNGMDRWEMPNEGLAYVVGQPIMYYAPIYAGVDPADGAPMWYIPGENPDVTTKDPARTTKKFDEDALLQNTGLRLHAPVTGGFGLHGGWKFLSFAADFSYSIGKTLLNNDAYFYANPNNNVTMNKHKSVSDFWTPSNVNARYPDWTKGYVMQFDTHLYEDASFLRLKNLQVGVSLPNKWLEAQHVFESVKLTFTGRNLLTCTKYEGLDPEVASNLVVGLVSNTKQYLLGLELTF
ncbi:MAG: SusC/RagA family TonB-linked outer membrane protein [Bacteroidales bacterium]|nr:SusC/RagA family TonB-linked outer membrane protein [Bacteroidales bacterium]